MKKSDSGITLVALVITIIILLILGTTATITGIRVAEESRLLTFKTEMKIMRLELNSNDELEKYRKTDSDTLTDQQKVFLNKVQNELNNDNIQITLDIVNFKFFTKAQIKDLSSQEISTDLYINANTKTIVSSIGVDYQGKTYYMLEQLPDNLYSVEERIQNSGDVEFEVISKDKQIIISNIKYNAKYVEKGTIQYKLSTDEFWTTVAQDIVAKNYTFEVPTFGEYNIKITDAKNNESIASIKVNNIANEPNIDGFDKTKTYYVAWNLNTEETTYIPDEKKMSENVALDNWYDYTAGVNHWANIKTTGGGNDCYWVWIPRYAYKITYTAEDRSSGTIDVVFLKGQTNNDMNGKDVTSSSYVDSKGQTGAYIVHPAFTNEGNGGFGNLTGIWVAKYEASSNSKSIYENPTEAQLSITGGVASVDVDAEGNKLTNTDLKVRVKPNVTSWRGIKLNDIFIVCRNLTKSGNSLEGTTGLDSHMMKNTEWGAVAYLSRSLYGINGEVWNNPYYNNTTNYSPITGLCSNETDGKDKGMTDVTKTCKYNEVGGENASTTGNVYGVYDMAGGAWEHVAGVLSSYKSNGDNTEKNNYYDFSNSNTYPNKYFDWYEGTSSDRTENYNANTGKYGDAVYETSSSGDSNTGSWDSSFSLFLYSSRPVFVRGGGAYNGGYVGVFAFSFVTGQAFTYSSFRPCLVSH